MHKNIHLAISFRAFYFITERNNVLCKTKEEKTKRSSNNVMERRISHVCLYSMNYVP